MVGLFFIMVVVLGTLVLAGGLSLGGYLKDSARKELKAARKQAHDSQLELSFAEDTISAYENFLMRLGADDVGDPQLEARIVLTDARKNSPKQLR